MSMSLVYRRYLDKIERCFEIQHTAKNKFVKTNLRRLSPSSDRAPFTTGGTAAHRPHSRARPADEGRRALRSPSGLPVLHVRLVVDPTRDQPRASADSNRCPSRIQCMLDIVQPGRFWRRWRSWLARATSRRSSSSKGRRGVPRDKLDKGEELPRRETRSRSIMRSFGDGAARGFIDFLQEEHAPSPSERTKMDRGSPPARTDADRPASSEKWQFRARDEEEDIALKGSA